MPLEFRKKNFQWLIIVIDKYEYNTIYRQYLTLYLQTPGCELFCFASLFFLTHTLLLLLFCFSTVSYVRRTQQHRWRCADVTFRCTSLALCERWIHVINEQLSLLCTYHFTMLVFCFFVFLTTAHFTVLWHFYNKSLVWKCLNLRVTVKIDSN